MIRRALSNNRAGLHKEVGLLALIFIVGCTYVPQKNFECVWAEDKEHWQCKSLVTEKYFKCEYINGTSFNGTNSSDN